MEDLMCVCVCVCEYIQNNTCKKRQLNTFHNTYTSEAGITASECIRPCISKSGNTQESKQQTVTRLHICSSKIFLPSQKKNIFTKNQGANAYAMQAHSTSSAINAKSECAVQVHDVLEKFKRFTCPFSMISRMVTHSKVLTPPWACLTCIFRAFP
jgi:hypothetical protein